MITANEKMTVSIWESLSLEELAEQQGVAAVSDLDEISALWPVNDDPDEHLRHILHEREARRTLAEGDPDAAGGPTGRPPRLEA